MNAPMDQTNTLRLRLVGEQAQRGVIPAADVGRLLLGSVTCPMTIVTSSSHIPLIR